MHLLWRGGVEAWECDEMGHMNVRFWVRRMTDGLTTLAHLLDRPTAYKADGYSSFIPVRQHIRFIKEAHAGAPLVMYGGIVSHNETDLTLYAEIHHSQSSDLAATFLTKLVNVSMPSLRPFPFTNHCRHRLDRLTVELPAHGAPRSLPFDRPRSDATVDRAKHLGFTPILLSSVQAGDVDAHGFLRTEGFIGRISEGVPNLMAAWRQSVAAEAETLDGAVREAGAAVLENRLDYVAWPRAGDLIEGHSAVVEIRDKTHTLQHWLCDPSTGKPWCISEAVAITFDLNQRKAIPTPPKARRALEAMQVDRGSIPFMQEA